jgi:hypothetical protein
MAIGNLCIPLIMVKAESFLSCEVKGDQLGPASINQAITIDLFIASDEQRVTN